MKINNRYILDTLDHEISRRSAVWPEYTQNGLGMKGAEPSSNGSREPGSSPDWPECWETRDSCDGVGET